MSADSFRTRKNGLMELRFRFGNKRVSVYGKTMEDCLARKTEKIIELSQSGSQITVFDSCLLYCEKLFREKKVNEEGYKSLMKTARFIGRSEIGQVSVSDLNDRRIEQFRADVSNYAGYTVRKAIYMLNNIMKG